MAANAPPDRDGSRIYRKEIMTITAQETTTLPEGATITVFRAHRIGADAVGTYLRAARDRAEIEMRVDDVAPGSLRAYLDLLIRWIQRERGKLTAKPEIACHTPKNLKDFVHNMAQAGMFVFAAISDVDTTGNTGIPKASRSVPRKKRRANNHPAIG
jgi:hypothetical protein